MFFLVINKLRNNKWMFMFLLLGSIVAVAIISSIPIYTDGILNRVLLKDFEAYQQQTGYYPGRYQFSFDCFPAKPKESYNDFLFFREEIWGKVEDEMGVPLIEKVEKLVVNYIALTTEIQGEENSGKKILELAAYSGYLDHITVTRGHLPSADITDGVLEVLINESVQREKGILLDEIYQTEYNQKLDNKVVQKIKPVGFFSFKEANDPWWFDESFNQDNIMLMDYGLFKKCFLAENQAVSKSEWFYAIDYTKISIDDLPGLLKVIDENEIRYTKYRKIIVRMEASSIIKEYINREKQLRLTLWILQVPVIIMLAFYIFMVSNLIVENERNEIAVFKSRGASRYQIFNIYLIQSCLLSAVSVTVGIFLAIGICRILGASNGFLELVSRKALPITLNPQSVYYAIAAGVFSAVTMVIPAMKASRLSIVQYKQVKARKWDAPLWQKMFLDIILIGISIYGYKSFVDRQITLNLSAAEAVSVPVDPLLFLISTLFILGMGLLFLRIYPYFIRFVYWAGRKLWTPVLYTTFIEVGRSGRRELFLMLFIILTMSVGIFSANSARTINQNIEDKAYYEVGADIAMQPSWTYYDSSTGTYGWMVEQPSDSYNNDSDIIYKEPDYDIIQNIKGIEEVTRVLMPQDVRLSLAGDNSKRGALMALEPLEFSRVVWSSGEMLPHHISEYLNLLNYSPNAVIVSSAFRDNEKFALGDSIDYRFGGQMLFDNTIVAFVDYWPGINPHIEENNYFVIANLSYVQAKTMLQPYQVWMKKEDGVSSQTIYSDIEDKNISLLWLKDASQEIIMRKNDALLQGINGALTMGFMVTMFVSLLGFIIYWLLSIQSRRLQFGIFRAMGMSHSRVIAILVSEQIMVSLAAVLAGIIIGGMASDFFIPLLQTVYSARQQVPPFRIISIRADYYKIYAIAGFMLASGIIILGIFISRLKIIQAIKLGED